MLIASRIIDQHSELSGLSNDDHLQYVHTTIQRTITSSPIFSVNNTSNNSLNIKRIAGQTGKLLNIIAEDNNVLFSIDVDGSITTTSNISGNISGSDITSGLIDPSVLGTGTANSGTFLRGDNSWSNGLSFGTLIANNPFSISQVWNNSGINFEGFVLDCTDTSSGSSSYLMKLKTSGVIVTYVSKAGDVGAVSLSLGSGGITKVSSGLTLDIQNQNSSTTNLIQNRFSNGTFTQSSGTFIATQISPTLNQSSTAGYTALKIAVTETATGSGTKSLIDCQVGGVVKFNVSNAGIISSSTWNGATVGAIYGGTGLSGYAAGDTIYASATNTLAKLSGNNTSTQKVLTMTLNSPQWVDFALSSLPDAITIPYLSADNTFSGYNTFTNGTIITSKPFTITQTWNNASITFNSLLINITDSASSSTSLLSDWQVGGLSKFKIAKDGTVTINNRADATANLYLSTGLTNDNNAAYIRFQSRGSDKAWMMMNLNAGIYWTLQYGNIKAFTAYTSGTTRIVSGQGSGQISFYNAASNGNSSSLGTMASYNSLIASSGSADILSLATTIAQTNTAGYIGLKIAIAESTTGSGIKRLIDTYAGVSGTTNVFYVTNTGNIVATNYTETIAVTFDGQGSVLTAMSGIYRQIHTDGTIVSWTLLADQSGSITIDIKKSTYSGFPTTSSITASATPALSSVQKNTNSTLTGWTTSITSDDILEFAITGTPVSITRVVLLLKVKRL